MAKNSLNRERTDRAGINIEEEWELHYWVEELGCSEDKLRAALEAVGSSLHAVRARLKRTA
jgi:hypothetical protein